MNRDRAKPDVGKAFWRSLGAIVAFAAAAAIVAWWLQPAARPVVARPATPPAPKRRDVPVTNIPEVVFTDITEQAGIDFVHTNGAYGEKLLPETMGGGCAFFDFDNDDDQDLLLVDSAKWPWRTDGDSPLHGALVLYRNDGRGRFQNVTDGSGLDGRGYGMGVAVGDYDNDGHVDVFLTTVGSNRLLRNLGDGRFADVTERAAVAGAADDWSTSCGFFDYDRDGDLDLFVCNYVQWSRQIDVAQGFVLTGLGRAYGPPTSFQGTFPRLYRNEGDGRFADVSAEAGIQVRNPVTDVPAGKSLGVRFVDLDGDALPDVVVANDTVQNFVFHNRGDGTFEEIGLLTGIAVDEHGNARGAMGIDAAHYRNDRQLGIAIGNFANEMTALYVSLGRPLLFSDEAIAAGLGPQTRLELCFGLFFFDYDLDGRLDLLGANGHVEDEIHRVQQSQRYRQPAHLFWNAGPEQPTEFVSVPVERCGKDLCKPIVGRGAAYADVDGDGDLDVLLTQIAGPPLLLRNDRDSSNHFLRLKLIGTRDNRDAIGATVEVSTAGRTVRRQVMPTRSYLSQVELPVTVGLGGNETVDSIRVLWPDGSTQTVSDYRMDASTEVRQ